MRVSLQTRKYLKMYRALMSTGVRSWTATVIVRSEIAAQRRGYALIDDFNERRVYENASL